MTRILWYFKQLFPLTYWTTYSDKDGRHMCIWRMWFGRSFDVSDVLIAA